MHQDWLPVLMELTGHRGVELVIDSLGGSSWKKSYRALRTYRTDGSLWYVHASASGIAGKLRALKLWRRLRNSIAGANESNRGRIRLEFGAYVGRRREGRCLTQEIVREFLKGLIQPHVDRAFPFDQVAEAHRYIEARKNIGKVVLVP